MATATTPADLVRDAEQALAAAHVAEKFLAAHPDLPLERMHATGGEFDGGPDGPLLEVQLGEDRDALNAFATATGGDVEEVNEVDFRVGLSIDGVTVWVTAWELFDDERPANF